MADWAPRDLFGSAFLEPLVANVPYYEESRNPPSGNGHLARGTPPANLLLFCFQPLNMHTHFKEGVLYASKKKDKQYDSDIYSAPVANLTSSIW